MAEVKRSTPSQGKMVRHKSDGKLVSHKSDGSWTVPKGKDVQGVTRDASRQVIKNYGPALEKLKRH